MPVEEAWSEITSTSEIDIACLACRTWWTQHTTHWMPVSPSPYSQSSQLIINTQKPDFWNSWRNACKASTADSSLLKSRRQVKKPSVLTCFTHHLCAGSAVVVHFPTDVCRGAKTVASDQRRWFRWDRRSSRSDARHNMPKRYATLHRTRQVRTIATCSDIVTYPPHT